MPYATDFTNYEVNHFFNVEIGIPESTMIKLRKEGAESPEHLVECSKKDEKSIVEALRKSKEFSARHYS